MIRLLLLCLLLLPATTAVSKDIEGSADGDQDDEDLIKEKVSAVVLGKQAPDTLPDVDEEDKTDQFTLIVIIVAVTALTLSVAAIVTIMLVRRRMNNRQQGIYSVPTEQNHKSV
ncbi:uncharacterized protein si:dkey-262k9.2 [Brachionichthys hirsutus]|uniref:uncharacterized protein si:dkey-262k9.2 n=1 Tax=Brachionichthys hirsutus TaxID=412623 RepID=UPI0036046693